MNQGTLIVSLDFELFWGMQDVSSIEGYRDNILGGRKAIPQLLSLFKNYGIHATWATVGLMFAKNTEEARSFFPDKFPTYKNPIRSSYRCFEKEETEEPDFFYASDLIDLISRTEGMEIGSHTFSHYYCLEEGQTIEQFESDLLAAQKIAQAHGYQLQSLVLPRNQCNPEYLDSIRKAGFKSYRDEENDWIHEKVNNKKVKRGFRLLDVYLPLTGQGGYIPKKENGVWNLTGSRMYKPFFKRLAFAEKLKLHRIKKQMLHAAKNGLVFHFWWHPHNIGVKTEFHLKQLEEIFSYYAVLKQNYGMRSLNMGETADCFEMTGRGD